MKSGLFLRLLHPGPDNRPVHVNPEELEKTKILATDHNVLLFVYKRMKERWKETDGQIREFLEETEPLYYKNMARTTRQQVIAENIVSLLKGNGVPSLVFRGSQISSEFYRDPFCRISADIDILVQKSDVLTADEVLTKAEFHRTNDLPLKFLMSRLHHNSYRAPDSRDLVELHWNFGIPSYFNLDSEAIWNEVVSLKGKPLGLSPEMMVIQLLIHHHMHSFRELRILVDILWAFQKYENTIDWARFIARIEGAGLLKTTQIALFQIRNLWNDTGPLKAEEILSEELRRKRLTVSKSLLSFFSMDIKKRYPFQNTKDKVMARLALDRWNRVLYSFSKTFFPAPGAIKDLYGDPRNWTLPANYIRFISWRIGKT